MRLSARSCCAIERDTARFDRGGLLALRAGREYDKNLPIPGALQRSLGEVIVKMVMKCGLG